MAVLGNPKNTIQVIQKYNFDFQKRFGQNFKSCVQGRLGNGAVRRGLRAFGRYRGVLHLRARRGSD